MPRYSGVDLCIPVPRLLERPKRLKLIAAAYLIGHPFDALYILAGDAKELMIPVDRRSVEFIVDSSQALWPACPCAKTCSDLLTFTPGNLAGICLSQKISLTEQVRDGKNRPSEGRRKWATKKSPG